MKIVFIADAHLKGPGDPHEKPLIEFIDSLNNVNSLVILGDLFDFWTGFNPVVYNNYLPVLESLQRLTRKGVKIIYLEGNHDFAMGSFFKDTLNAEVYPDFLELRLDGRRFYLSHGDTVSMTLTYSLWRAYLRSPVFRVMARIATPRVVWSIAMGLSNKSRKKTYRIKTNFTEPRLRDFAKKLIQDGYNGVVLAHSHVAGVHSEGKGVYANPGSWAQHKSYLVYDNGEFRAERFTAQP